MSEHPRHLEPAPEGGPLPLDEARQDRPDDHAPVERLWASAAMVNHAAAEARDQLERMEAMVLGLKTMAATPLVGEPLRDYDRRRLGEILSQFGQQRRDLDAQLALLEKVAGRWTP